jgi:hypothetical protein
MHPILIAGAAVVGLPVLLHLLLRQQPKKLVFPALRFLQQRKKTSQRRVQLKHILLLLLRCLLLALFALALYQPTLSASGGLAGVFGEEPVAAVIVIDTSPSMGYREGSSTPLDEAKRRAKDLLNELPPNSKVAVLPSHDPSGTWQPTVLEARQQIDAIKEPSGSARSLGAAVRAAYDLLATVDADGPEGAEPLPKLVAVFGDRAAASWDANETSGLMAKRDTLPDPKPVHLFFDVGKKTAENLSITELRMDTDRLSGAADAIVTAFVRADGLEVPGLTVTAQLDDGAAETRVIDSQSGSTMPVAFTFRKPAVGFHTVTVKLGREDGLPFDNERSFTFEVQPKRSILAVADKPTDVTLWKLAHNEGSQEFDCTVVTPDALPPRLEQYEMVAVIAVADPAPIADKLVTYVKGGGKLLLAPDGPGSATDKNRSAAYGSLGNLLPAPLGEVTRLDRPQDKVFGRPWKIDEEQDLDPPLFAPVREWQKLPNIDIFKSPPVTAQYRELGESGAGVTARYATGNETKGPRAVVEKAFERGHVLMLTTRIDDAAGEATDFWNNFWASGNSWAVVFPWLVTKHLCDLNTVVAADAGGKRRYNFPTGAEVAVPVRGFAPAGERRVRLEGPGVVAGNSKFTLPADATALVLRNKSADGPRPADGSPVWELDGDPLFTQGTFNLLPDGIASDWKHRFSLAVPAAEGDLTRVPPDVLGELFGPEGVVELDQKVELGEKLRRLRTSFELFPALIIGVLIFFAFEGLMANRFYKLK